MYRQFFDAKSVLASQYKVQQEFIDLFLFLQRILSKRHRQILNIITISFAATGTALNAAVVLAIVIDPLKSLRKGAWITILNLAIADVVTCVSIIGIWGSSIFKLDKNPLYIDCCHIAWACSISASFLMLTFFTLQIFMITEFPLKSRFMLTEDKSVLVTITIWLFSFLLGLSQICYHYFPPQMSLKFYVAQASVLQFAVLVQIAFNIHIAVKIKKSGRHTGRQPCQNSKHKNIAKTVMILTFMLFLTAFPSFVFKLIELIFRLGHLGQSKTAKILRDLFYCYAPIMTLNFTANPILYSLRLPDYRRTLLAFLGQIKGKRPTTFRLTQVRVLLSTFQRNSVRRHCTDASAKELPLERASSQRNKEGAIKQLTAPNGLQRNMESCTERSTERNSSPV
mgnify:CR=1 FL=1